MFNGLQLPKRIFVDSSKYNEKIEVFQVGNNYRLSVNNIVQSINVDNPTVHKRVWGKLVKLVSDKEPNAQNILLLGLAGATMPHLFAQEMPNTKITAIEIDKKMIDVAKEFFDLDKIKNLNVINADAMLALSEPEEFDLKRNSFDVIIVDIYCGGDYPDLGKTGTFFEGLKRHAKPGALIVFNRIYITAYQNDVDTFIKSIEGIFSDVNTCTVAGRTNSDNMLISARV
jgi:spermidine synthase